jgi:TetR/AcrR family transcriptional regulator, transcriptional repressor for nem operon
MTNTANTGDRVLAVAMKLFSEKGYGATSIQDILHSADVHAGSLYHFFPTKQDLLVAVLARYRDGLFPMLLDPAWKGVDDPIERIFALLARYRAALVATDFFYGCPIGSIALEIHEPDPAVRELLAENFTNWCAAIEQCLDAARRRIPNDVDKKELASFVLTTMEGAVMQSRTHRNAASFDAAVRQLRSYFVRMGALPRSERRKARPAKPLPRSKR